jgi:hypothetical protein
VRLKNAYKGSVELRMCIGARGLGQDTRNGGRLGWRCGGEVFGLRCVQGCILVVEMVMG